MGMRMYLGDESIRIWGSKISGRGNRMSKGDSREEAWTIQGRVRG